jgi:hypothetical protein
LVGATRRGGASVHLLADCLGVSRSRASTLLNSAHNGRTVMAEQGRRVVAPLSTDFRGGVRG